MRRIWRFLLPVVVLAHGLFAQNQDNFSLSGVVVNSVTGEPIRNAQVTLTRRFQRIQTRGDVLVATDNKRIPQQQTTFAGPSGDFQFTGLIDGTYMLAATKPGFMPYNKSGEIPAQNSVKVSSSMTGVQLKLAQLPAIEGKVLDQFGEPIPHAIINVYRLTVNEGERHINVINTAETNDRGMYRAHNLQPGKYVLRAMGPNGSTYNYIGDGSPRYESWEAYERIYWGGARDLDSATPIALDAGATAQADFSLKMQPAFRIRGNIEQYNQHQTVSFELRQGNEPSRNSRASINGTTGRFEIYDVVDGVYTLRGWVGAQLRGETQVTVKGANVNNVSLTLSPPVSLTYAVHILAEVTATKPANEAGMIDYNGGGPNCAIQLHDLQAGSGSPMQGGVGRAGASITEVFPGEYNVEVNCFGGYPIAAQMSGADLLANPKIVVEPGVAPPAIEITARAGGGTLSGKLPMPSVNGKTGVLLVPAAPPATPILIATFGIPGETSQFQQAFLAPGNYTAYLLKDLSEFEYRKPEVLQSLTNGLAVKIEDGKTTEIALTTAQ